MDAQTALLWVVIALAIMVMILCIAVFVMSLVDLIREYRRKQVRVITKADLISVHYDPHGFGKVVKVDNVYPMQGVDPAMTGLGFRIIESHVEDRPR